jgi:hypothetical protein
MNLSIRPRRPRVVVAFFTAAVLLAGPTGAFAQKYGATVQVADKGELSVAKTYIWTTTHPAMIKSVDAQIRAAVDRELAAIGLTRVESGEADVEATYASVSRLDGDVKTKTADGKVPLQPVGTIVFDLVSKATRKPVFRARVDTPINAEAAANEAIINQAIAALFEKYPTRDAK